MGFPMWHYVLATAPLVGLATYCVSQILTSRATRGTNPYTSLSLGFAIGLVCVAFLTARALHALGASAIDTAFLAMTNACTYLALAFGYFNFVNLTVASLRIRLLDEVRQAGGAIERKTLLDGYNTSSVTAIRLSRLVAGGHLVDRGDGRLVIGRRRFLAVARIFAALRWLVLGRE
jgi:hypothetical protein